MVERNAFDVSTVAVPVGPKVQQLLEFCNLDANIACGADVPGHMHIIVGKIAIAGCLAVSLCDEAGLLVVADHPSRNARCFRCLSIFMSFLHPQAAGPGTTGKLARAWC